MSQSPADGPTTDRVPPWDAFSGEDPPPPGPRLTALLGDAAGAIGELDERQLLGAGSAARRQRAYADYVEIVAVAEFGRRCAERLEASRARGDRVRSRDGEYPVEELGFEMTASAYSAWPLRSTWRSTSPAAFRPRWPGWRRGSSTGTAPG